MLDRILWCVKGEGGGIYERLRREKGRKGERDVDVELERASKKRRKSVIQR